MLSRLDEGTLIASAQTKNESAADVAKVFLDEFGRLATQPLDDSLVDQRRTLLIGSFQRQMETSAGFNGTVARLSRARPRSVGRARLHSPCRGGVGCSATATMARLLQPDRISLVIVGDTAKFIDKLRALRPDLELVPADKLDLAMATAAP